MKDDQAVNSQRRKLLQGAAYLGALNVTPVAIVSTFSSELFGQDDPELSGSLISKIADPVKTLMLRNHTDKAIFVEELAQSALMFDGGIVDCNVACSGKSIVIPANQIVYVQFDRRLRNSAAIGVEEYRRVQSRVTRLSEGTRVIPFTATMNGNIATFV